MALLSSRAQRAAATVGPSIPLPDTDFPCSSGGKVFVEVRLSGGHQDFAVLSSAMSVLENAGKHFMNPVLSFVIKHFEDCLLSSLCPSSHPPGKP